MSRSSSPELPAPALGVAALLSFALVSFVLVSFVLLDLPAESALADESAESDELSVLADATPWPLTIAAASPVPTTPTPSQRGQFVIGIVAGLR
ncbi:MAG: hypothetical protein WBB07_05140 [Mycobacterium sp.]